MHDYSKVATLTVSPSQPVIAAGDTFGDPTEELSDDQLEHVVGGLARVLVDGVTDALMLRHYHRAPSSSELML